MQLEGKAALITGAGSGIGRQLAITAARRGLVVHLLGRRMSKLEQTRRSLPPGAVSYCIAADITLAEDRLAVRAAIAGSGQGLDILVNNAGCLSHGALADAGDDEVIRMVDTNLLAPILLTRDLLPLLRRSARARIVNVGSVYGDIAAPGFAVYSATKFGLRGFSDALRRELAADGIGVTYAAPRATETEGIEQIAGHLKRQGQSIDDAETVSNWIWAAVERDRRSAYPPTSERVFVAIQRLFPSLIDRALGKQAVRLDRAAGSSSGGTGRAEAPATDRS